MKRKMKPVRAWAIVHDEYIQATCDKNQWYAFQKQANAEDEVNKSGCKFCRIARVEIREIVRKK